MPKGKPERPYERHVVPPPGSVEERDVRNAYVPTANQRVLGDPPPGRSALEQSTRT
jgi:hypothetical protein